MKKIGIILFGLLFIGIGVFIIIRDNNLKKNCIKTIDGKIVSVDETHDTDDNGKEKTLYYPIIEFKTENGLKRERYNSGSSNNKYSIGTNVTIMYNPMKESEFYIKGDMSSIIVGIGLSVMGCIVVIVGIFKKNIAI